ncbi:protein NLRC5-like [Amphiura filiformis]|uniref:protein NLRC5-like n=1 Tax=Amphiura filiformis TaxID=82378 RepID=UPI003B222604
MLKQCQDELIEFYLDEMSKVQLLPWGQGPEDTAEMDAIYVDLELIQQKSSEDTTKLRSNEDLVTLKTGEGQRVNRVLIQGETGSGKSTLAANIAYTWAKRDTKSPLSQFQLVFVIGMHEIEDSSSSLVDLIFQQILPEDSKVSRNGLEEFIKFHPKDVLIIIDGLDEDSSGMLSNDSSEVTQILHNRKLRQCCVILTTRPHRVTDLKDHQKHFTQVKLVGFSVDNVDLYISKFFQDNKQKAKSLIEKLNREPHLLGMAIIPVLLLMICLLWQDDCTLPESKSLLYKETIKYLWKRHLDKEHEEGQSLSDGDSDDEFQDELSTLLHRLGQVCIRGILQDDDKVVFKEKDFKQDVHHLGCRVGLITKKRWKSKLNVKKTITFLHKSFQDFCAAMYLSNLHDTNKSEFDRYLGKLFHEGDQILLAQRRKCVLEFCCGTNPKTVETIMKHLFYIINQKTKSMMGYDISNVALKQAEYLDISLFLCFMFESNLNYKDCMKLIPLLSSSNYVGLQIIYEVIAPVQFQLKLLQTEPSYKGHLFTLLKHLEIAINPDTWLTPLVEHTSALENFTLKIGHTCNSSYLEPVFHALSSIRSLKNLGIHGTVNYPSFDITKLLQLLTQKKGNQFEILSLVNAQFDCSTVVRFLNLNTAMVVLELCPSQPLVGYQEIIRTMHCLRNLKFLFLAPVPVGSDIVYLEPVVAQLQILRLGAIDGRTYHCNTSQIGLTKLLSFLHKAKKLLTLDLALNRFSVSAMKSLVVCLKEMPQLEKLWLSYTQLTDESAEILSEFLQGMPTSSIHTLYLRDNPGIGLESRAALNALSRRIKIYWESSAVEADNLF